jgi:O-antigen/teichoic acid export membrane protein
MNHTNSNSHLKNKVINSFQWTFFGTFVNIISQIAYTSVMGRLLNPEIYGVLALADTLLRFVSHFANMGVGKAVIQKEELSQSDLNVAFSLSFFLGLGFYGLVWLIAPFASAYYDNILLKDVLRAIALNFVISGIFATSGSVLRRNLQFNLTAKINIISSLFSHFIIGIGLAYMGYGIWSLVICSLVQSFTVGLWQYLSAVPRHNFHIIISKEKYAAILKYGSMAAFSTFMEFLSVNFVTLIVGKVYGEIILGYYNRALLLAQLPAYYLVTSVSTVLFPAMSRIQKDIERLKKTYLRATSLISFILLPAFTGLSIMAEVVISVVLGNKWIDSTNALQILAFTTPIIFHAHFGGIVLDAIARIRLKIYNQFFYILQISLSIFAFVDYGMSGLAICVLTTDFTRCVLYMFYMSRILNISLKDIYKSLVPAFSATLIVSSLLLVFQFVLHLFVLNLIPLITMMIGIVIGLIGMYISIKLPFNKPIRSEIFMMSDKIKFLKKVQFIFR